MNKTSKSILSGARYSNRVTGARFQVAHVPMVAGLPTELMVCDYAPILEIAGPLDANGFVAYCLSTQMALDGVTSLLDGGLLLPSGVATGPGDAARANELTVSPDGKALYWRGEISPAEYHVEPLGKWRDAGSGLRVMTLPEEICRFKDGTQKPAPAYTPRKLDLDRITDEKLAEYLLRQVLSSLEDALTSDGRKLEDFTIALTLEQPELEISSTVRIGRS